MPELRRIFEDFELVHCCDLCLCAINSRLFVGGVFCLGNLYLLLSMHIPPYSQMPVCLAETWQVWQGRH